VRSNARVTRNNAAELDQCAGGIADVEAIQILRRETSETFDLRDDVVFFSGDFDLAEVQSAEENLHRARNVFDGNTQRGGAISINVQAQFRLVEFKGGLNVLQITRAAKLPDQTCRVTIQF